MRTFLRQIPCFVVVLCILTTPGLCMAAEQSIGVLLSREIAPFVSMVEGMETGLGNRPVQRFFLDEQGRPYSLDGRVVTLDPSQYQVLVAVGPEALRYLEPRAGNVPLVYGMVLNPQKIIIDPQRLSCGVSLNLPVEAQFTSILRHLPSLTRLGVLFDPENNQAWFEDALPKAAALGLELIPLQVNRVGGRLAIIGDMALVDALLFIPDKSIISKAVIQHVIKQAVLQKTPVVGYNQFFHDSGATLNFVIDYRRVGEQVALQIERLLVGEPCGGPVSPMYETLVNEEVWRVLQLSQWEGE